MTAGQKLLKLLSFTSASGATVNRDTSLVIVKPRTEYSYGTQMDAIKHHLASAWLGKRE